MINLFIRPTEGRITSRFQKNRLDPVSKSFIRDHVGLDIAKAGTVPVVAAASGKIVRAQSFGGFGNCVMIEHTLKGQLITTVYAHLRGIEVRIGQIVSQGQRIGLQGNTGNSQGQHLHFEIHIGKWLNTNANVVDPSMWLPLEIALKLGDKGPNVELIQKQLVSIGYLAVADGHYGPKTELAVKAFQNAYKLEVDGICGPATQEVLANVKPPKPVAITPPKKEVDEMAQPLPKTQKDDMKKMLNDAYTKDKDGNLITKGNEHKRVFSVDHSSKVDTMTRGQAVDLLISYVARTSK